MTYQSSSLPTVIDKILTAFRGLSLSPLQVSVFDGFMGPDQPDNFVVVGGSLDPTIDGVEGWATVGGTAAVVGEAYAVSVTISCYVGGSDASSVANPQKQARDNAFTIFNAFVAVLRADSSFGGTVIDSHVEALRFDQTSSESLSVEQGREAAITFRVAVENYLS